MKPFGANDDRPFYKPLRFRVLSQEEKIAFDNMAPGAIWVGGNLRGAQPRGWGDNRGGWPVKISCTAYWGMKKEDKLGIRDVDAYEPMDFVGRYWFESYDTADRIRNELLNGLFAREMYEDALGSWLSFDPDYGLDQLEAEIRKLAGAKKLEVWTDTELLKHLEWQLALARRVQESVESELRKGVE